MVRRVVTGHDANGKAVVISDDTPPLTLTNPARPGYVSTDIWRTNADRKSTRLNSSHT
mgnify:CR=1 FL=1